MRQWLCCFILTVAAFALAQSTNPNRSSQPAAAERGAETTRLPVRRVVLFKNGVGYFEHLGPVTGTQDVSIDFTTPQLNDVLKSLTVIDLGSGRISDVSYNSVEPLDHQLGSLRLGLGDDVSGGQFLSALKGARVEVHSGAQTVIGRVLSVEEHTIKTGENETTTAHYLSVITEGGELRQFEMTPALGVRLLEADMREDVNRYLTVLASGREQDLRRMVIRDAGSGSRSLQVSYISEVPVWKSTYRLILPSDKAKPFIQGWAIVDNTVGEDWKDVELSLVAGAPQSFVQELSKPYYARRPEVGLPETAMLTPQTHERAVDKKAEPEVVNGQLRTPAAVPREWMRLGAPSQPGAATGGTLGGVVGGVGGGIGSGHGGGIGPAGLAGRNFEQLEQLARVSTPPAASGLDLGDLFEYRLHDRVTIRKNQSALVPIIQSPVEAEKVTIFSPDRRELLRAVWLHNTSALTLDGGTFNVLDGSTFAGEGIFTTIKPGERRLLSYAADQGVTVDANSETETKPVTRVTIRHGSMEQTREQRSTRTYTIRNDNTDDREVIVEHPTQNGWKLTSKVEPDETTPTHYRFKVHVAPKQTAKLVVEETYPVSNTYALINLNRETVDTFVQNQSITPEVEKALQEVLAKQEALYRIKRQIEAREEEQNNIASDQARLRENLKALKGSAEERELVQRYTRQLNQEEDTLDRLKKELAELHSQASAAQAELDRTIEQMTVT
jgi:hypothetical protein